MLDNRTLKETIADEANCAVTAFEIEEKVYRIVIDGIEERVRILVRISSKNDPAGVWASLELKNGEPSDGLEWHGSHPDLTDLKDWVYELD
jgi:hypothetical protein